MIYMIWKIWLSENILLLILEFWLNPLLKILLKILSKILLEILLALISKPIKPKFEPDIYLLILFKLLLTYYFCFFYNVTNFSDHLKNNNNNKVFSNHQSKTGWYKVMKQGVDWKKIIG